MLEVTTQQKAENEAFQLITQTSAIQAQIRSQIARLQNTLKNGTTEVSAAAIATALGNNLQPVTDALALLAGAVA